MKKMVLSGARRVLTCVPFLLLVLPLNAATQTVKVGVPAVNNGLSFVDATSGTSSTVINVGDTVHWLWDQDPMAHSATSGTCVGAVCQATPYWNSGEFFTPHFFDRTFNNPGVFRYFCTVHDSNMVGTLRVLPAVAIFTLQTPATVVGANPIAVAVGDFNGDGKLDLAVANSVDNTVTVLKGNGDGTFTNFSGSPISGFNSPIAIVAADFNQDGKLDLAVANNGNSSVTILLGNGDGTFTAGSTVLPGRLPQAMIAADFDGDGKMDLATAVLPLVNPTQMNVSILLGNGDGSFQAAQFFSTGGLTPAALAAFDFNKPDLAVANSGSNNLSVLPNTSSPGSLSFGPATVIAAGTLPKGITARTTFNDAQGNPAPGIAVANQTDNTVSVFLKNSMGNFVAATGSPFTVGSAPGAVVAGDFNGDGYLDLAVANSGDNSVTTLMNAGPIAGRVDAAGSFAAITTTASEPASAPRAIAADDFNGDNKPDLALANFATNHVSILLNGTAFPPPGPGPATHFGITVQSAGPLTPEGNPSTTAGVQFQITVTAYDAYQKIATGYRGVVHLTSSDMNAVLPPDYMFTGTDNGVHMFTVPPGITLKTADFQTIEVHDTVDSTINARSSDILVNPEAPSTFALTAPSTVIAGAAFTFSATAVDQYGNTTPTYNGTVRFTSSDTNGSVVLPGQTTLVNGTRTFNGNKLITAGNQTLTATDTAMSVMTRTVNIVVNPAPLNHLTIVPVPTNIMVGAPISITVSARDAYENLETNYTNPAGHPVVFSCTPDSTATFNPPFYLFVSQDNGTHTFNNGVAFDQVGVQTIKANDTFQQAMGTSPVVVTAGPTTAVSLAPLPRPFLLRQAITLTATVQVVPPATGTLSGTVSFFDGGVLLRTVNLAGSQASFITASQWTYTRHVFTAIYNGNPSFAPSPPSPVVVKSPRPH